MDGERISITGFCMGGRVAWLAAVFNPHFKAAVPFYGGFIFDRWGEAESSPFELSHQPNCPMMFHFGAIDPNPSPQNMEVFQQELERLGKPYEFHAYSEADHRFMDHTFGSYHQIGLGACRQPVGEENDGRLPLIRLRRAKELAQASNYLCFGVQVQGRKRNVQDQKPRCKRFGSCDGPSQRDPVALASGNPDAQFPDLGGQATGEGTQVRFQGGAGNRRLQNSLGSGALGGRRDRQDVLPNTAGEEISVLGQVPGADGTLGGGNFFQRVAIQQHLTRIQRVPAQ